VLLSVNALQRAQEGVFCRVLHKVLADPSAPGRRWTDQDERIGVLDLGAALLEVLRAELGEGWQPPRPFTWDGTTGSCPPALPRPEAAMDVETRQLQTPEALDLGLDAAGILHPAALGRCPYPAGTTTRPEDTDRAFRPTRRGTRRTRTLPRRAADRPSRGWAAQSRDGPMSQIGRHDPGCRV
jgi:hypothetical protein